MGKFKGTGIVALSDYKNVKWVGKTKAGAPVTITLKDAINLGNIDWTFAEKNDVVAQIVFTATYSNADEAAETKEEPWNIETGSFSSGAGEILLGAGVFYIGETKVALTRGGGQFTVTREYREINADGDRGPVKGRIEMESSRATLTMNVLTILTNIKDMYPAMADAE